MVTRLGVRAPCEQRARAPRVKNGLTSCSWLHLLKVWSLLKTRGDSVPRYVPRFGLGCQRTLMNVLALQALDFPKKKGVYRTSVNALESAYGGAGGI